MEWKTYVFGDKRAVNRETDPILEDVCGVVGVHVVYMWLVYAASTNSLPCLSGFTYGIRI